MQRFFDFCSKLILGLGLPGLRSLLKKNSARPGSGFQSGLLLALLSGLNALPVQAQEWPEMHLWARRIQAEGEPLLIRVQGHSRLFSGNLRLLAEQLTWAPDADWLSAKGQVELAAPSWELKADSLEFRPEQGFLSAKQVQLSYKDLQLKATQAEMTQHVWQLHQVEVHLANSPFVLQAESVRILPETHQENLQLEGITLPGLPWRWPVLTLNLPELNTAQSEIRTPVSVFQPEVGLVTGGLLLGFRSELWQDSSQRLYAHLSADPLQGAVAELDHEWRPTPAWLVHSQLGLNHQGVTAQGEALWQTPLGPWLRGRARWQQADQFANEFWLPPLQPGFQSVSDLELWLASDWFHWGALRTRWLVGGRWPQQQAGLTALAQFPLWQSEQDSLEASLLLNGLALPDATGTAGARLLYQRQLLDNLTLGGYLEQYVSSLGTTRFAQNERLSPWLSAYALWQPIPDLGLGLETALSLNSGHLVLADALISWRVRPFYLHLLLQGLPAGIQFQTRFEL